VGKAVKKREAEKSQEYSNNEFFSSANSPAQKMEGQQLAMLAIFSN